MTEYHEVLVFKVLRSVILDRIADGLEINGYPGDDAPAQSASLLEEYDRMILAGHLPQQGGEG